MAKNIVANHYPSDKKEKVGEKKPTEKKAPDSAMLMPKKGMAKKGRRGSSDGSVVC